MRQRRRQALRRPLYMRSLPSTEPPTTRIPASGPMPMHLAGLAPFPRLKLRTKLVLAGLGVIVAALIIRAATHHARPVDPSPPPAAAVDHGPGLPPADH